MTPLVFIELTDAEVGKRLVSVAHIVSLSERPHRSGTSLLLSVGAVHVQESAAEILDLIALACGLELARESAA